MAVKKPVSRKKAKDLDIGKTRGGEAVKGGASDRKVQKLAASLTDKFLR